jgi:secreted PhoX family phosphatase
MADSRFPLDRRSFLRGAAVVGAGSTLLSGLASRLAFAATGRPVRLAAVGSGGYGPLAATPDFVDGVARLSLPAGFRYTTIGVGGSVMSDGNVTPSAHDGMAAYAMANGHIRLIRNHEQRDGASPGNLVGNPAAAYDLKAPAACASLEVEVLASGERRLVRDFISINGTHTNCAGGVTSWNSWLTCEETTVGTAAGFDKPHGYAFDIPAAAEDEVDAVPLKALGRFAHEAMAVDPRTGDVYETEDRDPGGVYRFIPATAGNLNTGRLQMLAIKNRPQYDTRTRQHVPSALPAVWVEIADPDPVNAETVSGAVYNQGLVLGGALFARPEGCWWAGQSLFFTCTSGGDARMGQVWEYRPTGRSEGVLLLVFESPSADVLAAPDNIAISPRGGIVLCEDSNEPVQYVRGLTRDGRIFDFAANRINSNEFAGACFSPDGETLFVNVQGDTRRPSGGAAPVPGYTFAVWGPFADGAL